MKEALELREAVHADRPDHPDRRNAADWLISALLVNARAGDDARRQQARDLADRYGLDWAERQVMAAQYPDPTDQPPI
ncbi:MAG: hypothetical protein ACWA5A_01190 [Marinibacterium sp.]